MKRFFINAFVVMLAGCAQSIPTPMPTPSPEGDLTVMAGGLDFTLDAPPKDWIIATSDKNAVPNPAFSPLKSVIIDGVPALEIRTGTKHTIAIRRIEAMLIATPYLSWSWHLSNHGAGIHPVRLVIGFKGGAPTDGTVTIKDGDLPKHDRALSLVWGDTALRRGTLTPPPPDRPNQAAVYTVRGGRENTQKWWRDTVDLADLYHQSWPDDNQRNVHITFIGVAAAPRVPAVRGRVSNITLSR